MAVQTPNGKTVTRKELRKLLTAYKNGQSKTSIESELDVVGHRGKWITRAWYADIGAETGNSVLA